MTRAHDHRRREVAEPRSRTPASAMWECLQLGHLLVHRSQPLDRVLDVDGQPSSIAETLLSSTPVRPRRERDRHERADDGASGSSPRASSSSR